MMKVYPITIYFYLSDLFYTGTIFSFQLMDSFILVPGIYFIGGVSTIYIQSSKERNTHNLCR